MALVIGNDDYQDVIKLQKARADAVAVAATLADQGFVVTEVTDATRREMNRQIAAFTGALEPGDTALVFFAGHGVEIEGENYLLPTDIAVPRSGEQDFIRSESIALSDLLDRVRRAGARTTLAIIDACRENPFTTTAGRAIGGQRGLGRIAAPQGTFVIFSAGAGQLALDRLNDQDMAENSVFTRLLLPRLAEPGLELREMMSGLRREVRDLARTVGHEQFPAYYDELLGQFYFSPAVATAAADATEPRQTAAEVPDAMRADFDLAQQVGTRAAYDLFLERYSDRPDAFLVAMALRLRDDIDPSDEDVPAAEPAAAPRSDRREIIRATQTRLNALGCGAGGADGIAGRRTLAAFDRFLSASNTTLSADDLGTAEALAVLEAASGEPCAQVAAAPAPSAAPSASAPAQSPAPSTAPTYSLTGTWVFSANCPMVGRVTGQSTYRSAGGNRYSGTLSDSLGQSATLSATLNGRSLSETQDFGWVTIRTNGTFSADGRSISGRASQGCTFSSRKAG